MIPTASQRISTGRSIAQLVSFAALGMILQTTAYASCGDYLLHGADNGSHQADMNAGRPADLLSHASATELPAAPRSACEGGRCQSAPLAPPADPPRISVPKQPATLVGVDDSLTSPDDGNWSRPVDGLLPGSPFLEIASPPPRLS
ncbi:MAG: hypothetical protein ACO1RT_08555 [Planctomycetaceae bacterium]